MKKVFSKILKNSQENTYAGINFMVAKMLQKSKFLLYFLYTCYIKFYFGYIFQIYVACFFFIFIVYFYLHII